MIRNKRGISEIVATVLLIALTIIVAVIIFTWGTFFVSQTTEEVQETSSRNIACTDVRFEILSVSCSDGKVNIGNFTGFVVENKIDKDISSFIVRVRNNSLNVLDPDVQTMLQKFGIVNINYGFEANINSILYPTLVEVIPKITLEDGREVTCSAALEDFNVIDLPLQGACGGDDSALCKKDSDCSAYNMRCSGRVGTKRCTDGYDTQGWQCDNNVALCQKCVQGRIYPVNNPGPNSDCVANP